MSKEKQIEEMANAINFCKGSTHEQCLAKKDCKHCLAEQMYNAGYRKQSEGEWHKLAEVGVYVCTACTKLSPQPYPFCPKCGAKMKGGAE